MPAILLTMPGPATYTGQDTAELVIPGNPLLVRRVLDAFTRSDQPVRLAGPGEFTARAFLAGRLSAEQAEGVGALIAADSDAERVAARRLTAGHATRLYDKWAAELADVLALVEAGIDFVDQQDVVAIAPDELLVRVRALEFAIRDMLGSASGSERSSGRKRAVIIGPPNAGKSTLFNALLGVARSVAYPTPGATRDAIRHPLPASPEDVPPTNRTQTTPSAKMDETGGRIAANAEHLAWWRADVELVDLAGLDAGLASTSAADARSQAAARDEIAEADVVLWCDPSGRFDDRSPASAAVAEHAPAGAPVIRVHTKADLLAPFSAEPHEAAEPSDPPGSKHVSHAGGPRSIGVCALDGWNIAALRRAIFDAASADHRRDPQVGAVLLARHRAALTLAHDALADALDMLDHQHRDEKFEQSAPLGDRRPLDHPEMIAGLLRDALDHLGEISGRISPDDVIGRVFATFCVGK